jgi:hypothetical protein
MRSRGQAAGRSTEGIVGCGSGWVGLLRNTRNDGAGICNDEPWGQQKSSTKQLQLCHIQHTQEQSS